MQRQRKPKLSEDAEIHAAIASVLYKSGMGGEIMVFAMFQHKDAIGCQQLLVEYLCGQ